MPVLHAYGLHEIANMYKSFSEFTDFYNHIEQYEAVGLQQLIEDGSYPHNNSDIFFCGNTSSLNSNCASTLRHHNAIIGKTEDKSVSARSEQ
ncbi:hypothetical protein T4D_3999 [Trichinella pseudospiralis]|uniref:Uncharacterized protein n=1 Tax=Trichinella pseudospiralis TaxID=6337 RepID=A0A0V1FJS4_TRIPS|nr:hypothetical protein T4D_3999 [Trichinella pseudospiralis]